MLVATGLLNSACYGGERHRYYAGSEPVPRLYVYNEDDFSAYLKKVKYYDPAQSFYGGTQRDSVGSSLYIFQVSSAGVVVASLDRPARRLALPEAAKPLS